MQKEIKFNATFTGFRNNQFNWIITINEEEFNYFQGEGHFTSYFKSNGRGKNKKPDNGLANEELKGWLHKPTLNDVLYCILGDMSCGDETFNDFCDNFGYSTDSRRALKTYLACQENATKIKRALSWKQIEQKQKELENY